jgi:hypothetical protein
VEELSASTSYEPDSQTDATEQSQSPEPPAPAADEERKFIIFESSLQRLLKFCPDCGSPVVQQSSFTTGCMVTYRLECHEGHEVTWRSQPMDGKRSLGNILAAAAILFSGLTFMRAAAFAAAMNLVFLSKETFCDIQKKFLWPLIQAAWDEEQRKVVNMLKKRKSKITVSGDCRCDSPGYCAKYGSYSLMDSATNLIVSMQLVDSSEVSFFLKSSNILFSDKVCQIMFESLILLQVKNSFHMEPEGMRRCLNEVKNKKVRIDTLATDQHMSIGKILREEYKQVSVIIFTLKFCLYCHFSDQPST